MRRRRGYTLAETLAGVGLLGLISLVVVVIFNVANMVMDQGSGRIMLAQRTREAMRRISPLVSSAVPVSEDVAAIVAPAVGATTASVDFTTTPDLLTSTTFDPRVPSYITCRIGTTSAGDVLLWQLDAAGHILVNPSPRLLARGISSISFTRTALDTVTIQVSAQTSVRNAREQQRVVSCTLKSALQIPYYGIHQ